MRIVDQDILCFFDRRPAAMALYEAFAEQLARRYPDVRRKVQKTQIQFANRHGFACVSFARVKRKSELPEAHFVLTLGLPYPLESERVAARSEPYPGRWTTHFVIGALTDLDGELWEWVDQAYAFSKYK